MKHHTISLPYNLLIGIICVFICGFLLFFLLQTTNIPHQLLSPIGDQKKYGVTIAGAEFPIPTYPGRDYEGFSYFHSKGLTLVRLPFSWEKLQPQFGGNVKGDKEKYKEEVRSAEAAGELVIIEPHNFGRYSQKPLSVLDANVFGNFWEQLVSYFKDEKKIYGYELMNEPHDLDGGCQTWQILSQAAINAIRRVDMYHPILVPGYDWQGAWSWDTQSNCLKDLLDPAHKLIFAAHQYFDSDYSGTKYATSSCSDKQRGVTVSKPFLTWLQKNNLNGMFTEYGVPENSCWLSMLDTFLQDLQDNPHIVGGIYWAGGPGWGDYELSVEPSNGQDKPQMEILKKYSTH